MKFTDIQCYQVSPEQLLTHLTDVAFLTEKYQKIGREEIQVEDVESAGPHRELRASYQDFTDLSVFPDIVQKVMKDKTLVAQVVRWDLDTKTGSIELNPDGPARMTAATRIAESADGCELHLDWDVTVSLPLVGRKLEKYLVESMRSKAETDQKISQALISA